MSQRVLCRAVLSPIGGLLLALAAASSASPARASGRPAVRVGEVSISRDAGAAADAVPDLGKALRLALSDELSRVSNLGPLKQGLIVSATLTRLSSERREQGAQASAAISLALRRADDHVLLAELRGRASVEEPSGNLAILRRAALHGALRGALTHLPEAVQRSR